MKSVNKKKSIYKVLAHTKNYRWLFSIVIISLIGLSVFAALRPYMAKHLVDTYIIPKEFGQLKMYALLMAIVLLIEISSQFLFSFFANALGQNIIRDIRLQLFQKMLRYKQSFFDKESVGKLVTRNVSDIENIASIFSQGLFTISADILKMLVVLGVMFYMNWKLTLLVSFFMALILYFTRIFQKKMKKAFEEVRTQIAQLNTFVQERISGMKIVQLFNQEEHDYQKFYNINKKHKDAWKKNILYNSIFFPVAEIISSITLGCVILYGAHNIIENSSLTTTGDLFAYTMMISMLFNPLRQIADKFNAMQMGIVAADRVFEIIDLDENTQTDGSLITEKLHGKIEFKNVYFSYSNTDDYVLRDLNLTINEGKTVAFVGASGAGKSTIINLLSRLYDIQKGEIYIDGIPVQQFTLESLRKQIAVVLQDVFLFNTSILKNVTLDNPNITLEEVQQAAKAIGIHQFIEELPNQYHYQVRERGAMLSAGQKQLLAFLRAYVSNPSILILDEATSSIDTHTEEMIQKATNFMTKDRTSIIIAHRLSTIINADIIVVIDKGEIVEKGTHQELMNKNGYYKNLYTAQFLNTDDSASEN